MMAGLTGGGALLTVGTLPFVAGVASNAAGLGEEGAPKLLCPFATATGLPCPFCGASRAFRFAAAGDPAFLRYNAFWVAAATVLVIVGAAMLLASGRRGTRSEGTVDHTGPLPLRLTVGAPLAIFFALVVGGWCVALANRDAIMA